MSKENKTPSPIQFDILEVTKYRNVTPGMRRISFKGCKAVYNNSLSPGSHLKVFIPRPGQQKPVLQIIGENGRVVHPADDQRATVRTYTLRNLNLENGEIDIDFVLHGDEGPASAWAEKARPGDFLGVAYREGLAQYNADWYLFAGDETALPAISAIIENLPASAKGTAFIEVANAGEEQQIITESGIEVNWLHRNGIPAGYGSKLSDAVLSVQLPDSTVKRYVWIAAEFVTIKELRNHFKETHQLDKTELHATAYWKLDMDEDKFHDLRHQQMAENNQ
ncbi:siderophore-interacting protein [Dyadobacter sp. CY312]|uniref:siderophore-interacting protein n=1 Tax=Dyadobacter sp. CY312 TaxID=2907303 RepID=UPI001F197ABC|nr:siderophore-interacting protein [Dyadobacter sp. CY312]MCE7040317.1 siderophore-interacting protein [Dyadobacter sp. CY312]